MKRLTGLALLLLSTFLVCSPAASKAQGLFYAQSATLSTATTDSCSGLSVSVLNWMGCINFTVGPGSFTISGNTIDVDVNCTSSPICAGAISQPLVTVTIPSVPAGTYTVNGRAFLDRSLVNSVSAGTLTVSSCNTVGIQSQELEKVQLAPNPARDYVELSGANHGGLAYELLDIKGSIVLSGMVNNKRIELSGLTQGLYFIRLSNKKEQSIKRLVIQK